MLPKNALRTLIVSAILGVALYTTMSAYADFQKIQESAVKLGLQGWLILLGLSLINYGLRYYRWQGYLKQLSYNIPQMFHSICYLSGFAFTITPGKIGEAVRALYLKSYKVSYKHSIAVLFTERFIDLVVIVLLSLLFATVREEGRWTVIIVGGAIVLLLPLIHSDLIHRLLNYFGSKIKSIKVSELIQHLIVAIDSSASLLKTAPLYKGVAIGLIAWGAEGYGLYLLLSYLGVEIAPAIAIGIYAIATLIGAVSFIPGGLGSTEVVMILLLGFYCDDTSTAIAATLICRIATLWFAVVLGLLAVSWLELVGKKQA